MKKCSKSHLETMKLAEQARKVQTDDILGASQESEENVQEEDILLSMYCVHCVVLL